MINHSNTIISVVGLGIAVYVLIMITKQKKEIKSIKASLDVVKATQLSLQTPTGGEA